jgi:hypothetical protein
MVERTARRQPQKVAVVHGETRTTYGPAGKILKRELRETVAERLALEQSH